MGCDIHCYIERRPEGSGCWIEFGGEIHAYRDYEMFGRIAGVRVDGIQMVPLRGMPRDIAYAARKDYLFFVRDRAGPEFCTKEEAERWIASGCSDWWDAERTIVTNPDAHTPSWATADELGEAIKAGRDVHCEYHAMLAAMRAMEAMGEKTRLVFWFDN